MYLKPTDKYWAIDIEGDLIPSSVIYCLCAVNIKTNEEVQLVGEEKIREWVYARLLEGCTFIGHNIIGYDAPTINRLLKLNVRVVDIIDTMLMSMFYNPSLEGGHSLEAWGKRLRFPKTEFNDFSKFSEPMLNYCLNDTILCAKVYKALVIKMLKNGFTENGIKLEHESWALVKKQQQNGFHFNIEEAHILYAKLKAILEDLTKEIYETWPPTIQAVATYKRPYKKDGDFSSNFLRHRDQYQRVEISKDRETYTCFDYVSFNIGSALERIEKLLELGWQPKEFTEGGSPKPTDKGELTPSLRDFVKTSGRKEPKLIADWIKINSRAIMINTWMTEYNEETGAIHGNLWLANTLRYRHSGPNTANIPAVEFDEETKQPLLGMDGDFKFEARNLWETRDKKYRKMVGVDAKGIQLRVLAHHLNNEQFSEAVLNGDPHSYNQQIGGFRSRPIAKTFIYAFLLGAGDEKVGQIIGGSKKDGREVKDRFIGNFPGLAELLESLQNQIKRTGRIKLIDGTPIIVTKDHTRLGYLLQGDENRIMKTAKVIANFLTQKHGIDVLWVGDIHDEWQCDVANNDIDKFIKVCEYSFRKAGEVLNYRVPIECDAKVGLTWAETH